MNPKTKKILSRIFKIIWIILGCFLALMFVVALIRAKTFSGSGFSAIGAGIAAGVFIAVTFGVLAVYAVATGLFIIVRLIIKKVRGKKND